MTVQANSEQKRIRRLGQPPSADRTAVRISLARRQIQEIRTRQGIGGGFIEAMVDGVYIAVLAYSNAQADVLHKAVLKLQTWLEGAPSSGSPSSPVEARKSPKLIKEAHESHPAQHTGRHRLVHVTGPGVTPRATIIHGPGSGPGGINTKLMELLEPGSGSHCRHRMQ